MGRIETRRQVESPGNKPQGRARAIHSREHNDRASEPPPSSAHPDPADQPDANFQSAKVRTGIVSVNGQDVGIMHCRHR